MTLYIITMVAFGFIIFSNFMIGYYQNKITKLQGEIDDLFSEEISKLKKKVIALEKYLGVEYKPATHIVSVEPFKLSDCDSGCGRIPNLEFKHEKTPAHYEHTAVEKSKKELEKAIKNHKDVSKK